MHPRRLSSAALAAAVLLAAPLPAHAQIGGLLRRAVGEKVLDKAAGTAEARAGTTGPEFTDRVLEITGPRVDQLLKGLAAERAEGERVEREEGARAAARARYEAEHAEWERKMAELAPKRDAYDRCSMNAAMRVTTTQQDPVIRRANEAIMAMPEAQRERFQERMEALSEQWEAAKARGDKAEATRLEAALGREYEQATGISAAEMRRALAKTEAAVEGSVQQCGEQPVLPPEPRNPDDGDSGDGAQDVGARASGLTEEQYAVLRERVVAFLVAKGEMGNSAYVFSANERTVLQAREGELKAYEALLRGEEG